MVVGMLLVFLANVIVQRRQRGREIPPNLAELQELSSNPLQVVRHPVATLQAWVRVLRHPIKSNRETRDWFNERGL